MPDIQQDTLTLEDFLNLSKNAGQSVKEGSPELKDQIVRIVFLNVWIDTEKVTAYRLKEPLDTLLKDRLVLNGRVKATDFERLAQTILSCWKPLEVVLGSQVSDDCLTRGENNAGLVYNY